MIPGEPTSTYQHDGDPEALAAWMIDLIDESPDRLAIIELPIVTTSEALDRLEETVIKAFDIAKRERPNLGVRLLHQQIPGKGQLALDIHEHQWVGGACVRGCGETREA